MRAEGRREVFGGPRSEGAVQLDGGWRPREADARAICVGGFTADAGATKAAHAPSVLIRSHRPRGRRRRKKG
jgi:hypothetical protein